MAVVEGTYPDVLLLEDWLPDHLDALDGLRRIHGSRPAVGVILLAGPERSPFVEEALRSGARGYVMRDGKAELSTWWSTAACSTQRNHERPGSALTARELEILHLMAQGAAIGERLLISPATVKVHVERMYLKLFVSGRVAAVAEAFRRGLLR